MCNSDPVTSGTGNRAPLDNALAESVPAESATGPRRRRFRIDEIDAQWHCAIIGTCLTLAELKAITAKFDITLQMGPSGYNLHATIVHLASHDHRIAKTLTKLLDRRHGVAVSRAAKVTCDAGVRAMWSQAMETGDIAGVLWAVMSHPATDEETRKYVFQDIHMLSHQVGAAARADIQHLSRLEREKSALEEKLAGLKEQHLRAVAERDETIRTLRRRLDHAAEEISRLSKAAATARDVPRLLEQAALLQQRLADTASRLTESDRQKVDAQEALEDGRRRVEELERQNLAQEQELTLYESRILSLLTPAVCSEDCAWECGRLDLCGRCILFVGGRNQQMAHIRRIVETCNGVFSHHDGGVEESLNRLHGLMGRADAILFPVDCVSHSAQDAVKQLCRRWQKPYIPVRRSGLGAYLAALESVARAVPPAPLS